MIAKIQQKGFTLIELLVYVGIFAIASGIFVGILIITLRVQNQQTGLVEISSQLNFAMQTIQRNIREASTITSPTVGSNSSALGLDGNSGIVNISLGTCGGVSAAICSNGSPLTTSKISVTGLDFEHLVTTSNHPSFPDVHTVKIVVTADNSTPNPAQHVSRTLQSSASPLLTQ